MTKKLFTIGYTGLQLNEFIDQLEQAGVELLIDVRELPISRKRGFSKTALAENLEQSGIEYRHLKWLGSPKSLRHEVRKTRDYDTFFSGVARHLREPNSATQVQEAIELAGNSRSCLMCCCENWNFCHRRCVVDAMLAKIHFRVEHLLEPPFEQSVSKAA